jgi:hypothetical protein
MYFRRGITVDIAAPAQIAPEKKDLTYVLLCTKIISAVNTEAPSVDNPRLRGSSTIEAKNTTAPLPCCSTCQAGATQCSALNGACYWSWLSTPAHCSGNSCGGLQQLECRALQKSGCKWNVDLFTTCSPPGTLVTGLADPDAHLCCSKNTCNWFC